MKELSLQEAQQLRRGQCPHCLAGVFLVHRLDGIWHRLCNVCLREYAELPAGPVIANEICPAERLKEVYGISLSGGQAATTEEFP